MVKIPGFDELKKMGNDLIDSAKTVKLGGVVDKFKSAKSGVDIAPSEDRLRNLLHEMNSTLTELTAAQAVESSLIKRMQDQLKEIAKVAGAQNATESAATPAPKEDDKQ